MRKINSYVEEVSWERIHMYVTIQVDQTETLSDQVQFYLVNEKYDVETEFQILSRKDNRFTMTINVTNSGINRCIQNGTYTILMVDKDERISEAGYVGTSRMLEGWGRVFRYLSNSGAYTVTCLLDEFSEESRFLLLFYNTVRKKLTRMPAEERPVHEICQPEEKEQPKEPFLTALIEKIKKKLGIKPKKKKKKTVTKIFTEYYQEFHEKYFDPNPKKQILLFMSEQDDGMSLNMQAVLDRMKERGLDEKFKFEFSLRKATSEEQTEESDIEMLKKVARAHIIIVDDHVPVFDKVVLDEHTRVIQIWHAGAGFKGVGYSRWGHCGCPGPYSCHRQYAYSISGSSNINHFFSEQFGILDEQVIPTGMPRMDQYLNKDNREKVTKQLYESYPQAKGKKVLLFAPTYRGRNRLTAYYPYEKLDFDELYRFCLEKDYVIFFKMHPWVSSAVPIREEHKDRFFDLNGYGNINDLFYITDLLITDYSSSMYEFSLMRKPMMFFAYDKVQYATSRGFHRDYDTTVPGKICETFEEILDALWNEDFEYEKVESYIKAHFDFVDDHATDRVIDWLILDELPKEYRDQLEKKKKQVKKTRLLTFSEYFDDGEEN